MSESTEEIPENESKEERKRRLAKLRARKCRERKRNIAEHLARLGKADKSEFTPNEPTKQKDQFDDLELLLSRAFGKSEEQKLAENKELEHAINQSLERQTQKILCPFCHSSVCRCNRGEPE